MGSNVNTRRAGLSDASAGASAAAAATSAAAAATAAAAALAGQHVYSAATTALAQTAAQADGTLANGAAYFAIAAGSPFASLFRKDSGAGSTDMQFQFPSATAMQLSGKTVPAGLTHAWHDPNGLFNLKVNAQGQVEVANLVASNLLNNQPVERVNETVRTTMANARSRGVGCRLPYDYCIVIQRGQSNSEGAQSYPPFSTTPIAGVLMMDAIRGRFFTGTRYANGFTPAVEVQDTDGVNPPWGETGLRTCGEMVQKLTAEECGSTWRVHQKNIVVLSIGHSSSDITDIWYGTPDFTLAQQTLAAMKAQAVAEGKTIGIIGQIHAWGANGYDKTVAPDGSPTGIGAAAWRSRILTYDSHIDTYLGQAIFGQPIGSIPVGFWQTFAHAASTSVGNPYGAEVENQLVRDFARYDIVNPEGAEFYENSNRHHSNREAARMGALSGLWVHRRCILKETWPNYLPVITRVDANTLDVSFPDVPQTHHLGLKETGQPASRRMQPNYTFVLYDPANRATTFAQSRLPKVEGNSARIYTTNPLPAVGSVALKYSADAYLGNLTVTPKDYLTEHTLSLTINGVLETFERKPGVFDVTGF